MIGLLQRVTSASVHVDGEEVGAIARGRLVLVAVHRDDRPADIARLAERILGYRVFPDAEDRMNRSLLVQQATVHAVIGIGEYPVGQDALGKPVDVGRGIVAVDRDQNQQAAADLADAGIAHADAGRLHALL